MGQSDAIGQLVEALAKARKEMKNPTRNHEGQARGGKYRYADLADSIEATRCMWEHGLSIIGRGDIIDGQPVWRTMLAHTSGEWIDGVLELPVAAKSQELGSAITYARRYARSAILDLATEDDDDGAAASKDTMTPDEAIIEVAKRIHAEHPELCEGENDAASKRAVLKHVQFVFSSSAMKAIDKLAVPDDLRALHDRALSLLVDKAAAKE